MHQCMGCLRLGREKDNPFGVEITLIERTSNGVIKRVLCCACAEVEQAERNSK